MCLIFRPNVLNPGGWGWSINPLQSVGLGPLWQDILLPPSRGRSPHRDLYSLVCRSMGSPSGPGCHPPPTAPPTCQGLHGWLVVCAQQLCLDGLHHTLEPTAGTWGTAGKKHTDGQLRPSACRAQLLQVKSLLLWDSSFPSAGGADINLRFRNGSPYCSVGNTLAECGDAHL